jgi:hypothetical protein
MDDASSTRAASRNIERQTDGRNRRPSHNPFAVIAANSRTAQQRDGCERTLWAVERIHRRTHGRGDVTWHELADELGYPTAGLTDRQIRNRYRARIANWLMYLTRWGLLDGYRAEWEPNGEGRCIVIGLPAGVAQSVRAARSLSGRTSVRSRRPPPPSPISNQVGTPLRGTIGGTHSRRCRESKAPAPEARGRATGELSTRDQAASGTAVAAALAIAVEFGTFEGGPTGVALLEARPDLATHPVEAVAREAWRLFNGAELPTGAGDCRLSPKIRRRLESAAAQLERTGYHSLPPGPAAPRAAVIDLALGDWVDYWGDNRSAVLYRNPKDPPPRRPRTLGGLACCLATMAHELLTGYRNRKDPNRAARVEAWHIARRAGADRV